MENPQSWGPVENTIYQAMEDWDETVPGLSNVMTIANALRDAGLVKEDEVWECANSPKHFPQLVCTLKFEHVGDHRCGEYSWE